MEKHSPLEKSQPSFCTGKSYLTNIMELDDAGVLLVCFKDFQVVLGKIPHKLLKKKVVLGLEERFFYGLKTS